MNTLDIEYNTERPDIRFPEYGRSIQEMLLHAKTIESPQKRQKTVESIINLMIQLGPQGNRNMDDYREKLWNHVFALCNYELDVTVPPGIVIRKPEDKPKPQPFCKNRRSMAPRSSSFTRAICGLRRERAATPNA